jgi:hypothetical protein
MSSEIIYHQKMARLPASPETHSEDLYFHMVQMGSSNCYEIDHRRPQGCGRRARSWTLLSMGTAQQVLNTAILFGGDCEGGMLKLGGMHAESSPEKHIRKTRKLLREASTTDLRNGMAYRGFDVRLTLKSKDEKGDTVYYSASHSEELKRFLSLYSDRLAQRTVVAWGMADVRGPEMR